MKEKLQEFALLAEIVSAICIVLSLLFVGLQVRQGAEETAANSEAIRSTVRQSMMDADLSILLWMGSNPSIVDPEYASTPEQFLARAIKFHSLLRTRSAYWYEYRKGLLDQAILDSYLSSFVLDTAQTDYQLAQWEALYADKNDQTYPRDMMDELNNRILREVERMRLDQ